MGFFNLICSCEDRRMSSNQVQEKPKVVPIIHERPKMPAKTWSALRAHIQAERKKKREEEGKQKEEERLKRERESKKKQEANNLEECRAIKCRKNPKLFQLSMRGPRCQQRH